MKSALQCYLKTCLCGIGAFVFLGTGSAVLAQTFNSGHPAIPIADNACGSSNYAVGSLTVAGIGVLGAPKEIESITFNITHTWVGDLRIYLEAPDGKVLEISTQNGLNGDNYTNTVIKTDAAQSVTVGTAPFTGTYKPEGRCTSLGCITGTLHQHNLTYFNGTNANGDWRLKVCDDADNNVGTLNSWSITFADCVAPGNLTRTYVSATSASLSFDCSGCTGSFLVEYGPIGFTPGTGASPGIGGTLVSGTSSPVAVTGLNPTASYDMYIRRDCGSGAYSTNVGPVKFLPGDACANALDLAFLTSPYSSSTTLMGNDFASCSEVSTDQIFKIVVQPNYKLEIRQTATYTNNVYRLGYGTTCSGGTQIACRVNYTQPEIWQNNTGSAQTVYWVQDGALNYKGNFTLAWTLSSCPKPTNVIINSTTATTAHLSWTPGGNCSNGTEYWVLPSSSTQPAAGTGTSLGCLPTFPISITGLTAGTTYDVWVGEDCGINGTADPVKLGSFTATCSVPTNVTRTINSPTSANLNFNCTGCTGSFLVEYGPIGFVPGTGASPGVGGTIVPGVSAPIAVTGLNPATSYDMYIRRDCGGGSYSANAGPVRFFPGEVCANVIDLALLTSPYSSSTTLMSNDFASCGEVSTDQIFKIVVPPNYKLEIRQTATYTNNVYRLGYGTTCPGGTQIACRVNYTQPEIWQNNTGSAQTVYWVQDGALNYKGNFTLAWTLKEPPECPNPSNLNLSNITTTGATLQWTPGGSCQVKMEYWVLPHPSGSPTPGTGTALTCAPAFPLSVSGLTPGTKYDVWVFEDCSNGFVSGPNYMGSFTTVPVFCTTTGQTTTCSPVFDAPAGTGTNHYYDQYPFTVPATGLYNIQADWTGFDGYLYLYTSPFDPATPGLNLLASNNDHPTLGTAASLINQVSLSAGVQYVVVGTTYDETSPGGSMAFSISGAVVASCPGTTLYNGYKLEVCDGVDNNCDGLVDNTNLSLNFTYSIPSVRPCDVVNITWSGGCPGWDVELSLISITPFQVVGSIAPNISNTGSFTWTIPPGLAPGSYQITIRKNGAPLVYNYGAIFQVLPATASISATTTTLCAGKTATLTASGGGTYLWSTGGTIAAIQVTPLTTTTYTVSITNSNGCTNTVSKTITVLPAPVAGISGNLTICQGQSTTLTASGGGTYKWSNFLTSSSITVTPSSTTTYSVTVTNADGCTAQKSVTVIVNLNPTATIAGSNPKSICPGTSETLVASGGVSYLWSTGANTASIIVSPSAQTIYTVTVTNSRGCTNTKTVTVALKSAPTPVIQGPSAICSGQNAILSCSSGSSRVWSTGETGATIVKMPIATTTYSVTVTHSNGCTSSASKTVVVNPVPTATIQGNLSLCKGKSTTLFATSGNFYKWSNGAMTPGITVAPLVTTIYRVTVTNNFGCSTTASATVQVNALPVATISGTSPICNGSSTTLAAGSGGTYAWSTGATTSTITAAPTATTTYRVTVTNGAGCTASASKSVIVYQAPPATITGAGTICAGGSATLTSSAGSSYKWSTTATTAGISVSPVATTTYTVTVTYGNGCTRTASATVTVTPTPTVAITGTTSLCQGQSTTLTASGGGSYLWSTTATTASITVSPAATQTYTVTVTGVGGCTAALPATVTVLPKPDLSVSPPASICTGQSLDLESLSLADANNTGATVTYHDDTPATPLNELTGTTVSPGTSTTYYVLATAPGGCTDEAGIAVTVMQDELTARCKDITVDLNPTGEYQLLPAEVDDGSAFNCGSVNLTVNPDFYTCDNKGENTYVLIASASNGATATCTGMVTVKDTPARLIGAAYGPPFGRLYAVNADGTGFGRPHTFDGPTGLLPYSDLTLGSDDFVYGTASEGGTGHGVVFRIAQDGSGFAVLHAFDGILGSQPRAGVIEGSDGFLYGTTYKTSASNNGVVFRVAKDGTGFSVLHAFAGTDGGKVYAGVVEGSDGFLYGNTETGGANGGGVLFRVAKDGTGFSVLHSFVSASGIAPWGSPIEGSDGELYGAATSGGPDNAGVVFRIAKNGTGYTVLHPFTGGADGNKPIAGLIEGSDGRLYGAAEQGGSTDNFGVVYRLERDGSGFLVLHTFAESDGGLPRGRLTEGQDGLLYGTTTFFGGLGAGGVYSIDKDGTGYTIVYNHNDEDGLNCQGGVLYIPSPNCPACPKPVAECQDITVTLDLSGEATVEASDVDNGSTAACGLQGMGVSPNIFDCNDLGVQSVTLTVTDVFGRTGECTAEVTVVPGGPQFFGTGLGPESGSIFAFSPDGTQFSQLHHFQAPLLAPYAGVVQHSDGYLYGTTYSDGGNGHGGLFRVLPDGSNFERLHLFSGSDGTSPYAGLTIRSDGYLYGTTVSGTNNSVVFRIQPDGTDFSVLHTFSDPLTEGTTLYAGVTDGGDGYLYGAAYDGGPGYGGTIYRLFPDGTDFQVLKSFSNDLADPDQAGFYPLGSLLLGGDGFLYGTNAYGGSNNYGTIFRISLDGSVFELLHQFDYNLDGATPRAKLTKGSDGRIYGSTTNGGGVGMAQGTIFRLNPDGTGFQLLHDFHVSNFATDGFEPGSALLEGGDGYFYSTTANGGGLTGGTLFRLLPDGTDFSIIRSFDYNQEGQWAYGALITGADGLLYGTLNDNADPGVGSVFRVLPDGTDFEVVYGFNTNPTGNSPKGELAWEGDGFLYGTTTSGGMNGAGSVYRIQPDGSNFDMLYSFASTSGVNPYSGLLPGGDGYLYGTAAAGGAGYGVVYRLLPDGTGYQVLKQFNRTDGAYPGSKLASGGDGFLYGTTWGGGLNYGTVYRLHPDGTGFQVLHQFNRTQGFYPASSVTFGDDGYVYGTTNYGGSGGGSGYGILYRLHPDGTGFSVVHYFNNAIDNGFQPWAKVLLLGDGYLYGTTQYGGVVSGSGSVYRVLPDGTDFEILHAFDGTDGSTVQAGLVSGGDGYLYGAASQGGAGYGTLFRLHPDGTGFEVLRYLDGSVASNPTANLLFLPGSACRPGSPAIMAAPDRQEPQAKPAETGLTLFPNPTTGVVYLSLGSYAGQPVSILVQNSLGQSVLERQVSSGASGLERLDLSRFANGMYQVRLRVTGSAEELVRRVVVQRE
jgi:uncharacterized repeat protein (TIGR03803 family)